MEARCLAVLQALFETLILLCQATSLGEEPKRKMGKSVEGMMNEDSEQDYTMYI